MSYTLLNRNCCAFVLYEMISIVENGACIYTCLIKKRGFGLCWAGDVFGEHSKGETAAGLCFHGEAGLSTWEVEAADKAAGVLVMYVLLGS